MQSSNQPKPTIQATNILNSKRKFKNLLIKPTPTLLNLNQKYTKMDKTDRAAISRPSSPVDIDKMAFKNPKVMKILDHSLEALIESVPGGVLLSNREINNTEDIPEGPTPISSKPGGVKTVMAKDVVALETDDIWAMDWRNREFFSTDNIAAFTSFAFKVVDDLKWNKRSG